jgi:hypothetical protein
MSQKKRIKVMQKLFSLKQGFFDLFIKQGKNFFFLVFTSGPAKQRK